MQERNRGSVLLIALVALALTGTGAAAFIPPDTIRAPSGRVIVTLPDGTTQGLSNIKVLSIPHGSGGVPEDIDWTNSSGYFWLFCGHEAARPARHRIWPQDPLYNRVRFEPADMTVTCPPSVSGLVFKASRR